MERWSPYPRERYAVKIAGVLVGLGMHSAFTHPGVWNLFWLSSEVVDDLINWEEEPEQIPTWSRHLPFAIGTAEQYIGDDLIKDLASVLTAESFFEYLKKSDCSDLILPRMIGGDLWFNTMERKLYELQKQEIITIPEGFYDKIVPFNKNISNKGGR